MRRTACEEESENGGEISIEKRVLGSTRGCAESVLGVTTKIFATGGATEIRGEGIPWGSCETVQQLRSSAERNEQSEMGEGWATTA